MKDGRPESRFPAGRLFCSAQGFEALIEEIKGVTRCLVHRTSVQTIVALQFPEGAECHEYLRKAFYSALPLTVTLRQTDISYTHGRTMYVTSIRTNPLYVPASGRRIIWAQITDRPDDNWRNAERLPANPLPVDAAGRPTTCVDCWGGMDWIDVSTRMDRCAHLGKCKRCGAEYPWPVRAKQKVTVEERLESPRVEINPTRATRCYVIIGTEDVAEASAALLARAPLTFAAHSDGVTVLVREGHTLHPMDGCPWAFDAVVRYSPKSQDQKDAGEPFHAKARLCGLDCAALLCAPVVPAGETPDFAQIDGLVGFEFEIGRQIHLRLTLAPGCSSGERFRQSILTAGKFLFRVSDSERTVQAPFPLYVSQVEGTYPANAPSSVRVYLTSAPHGDQLFTDVTTRHLISEAARQLNMPCNAAVSEESNYNYETARNDHIRYERYNNRHVPGNQQTGSHDHVASVACGNTAGPQSSIGGNYYYAMALLEREYQHRRFFAAIYSGHTVPWGEADATTGNRKYSNAAETYGRTISVARRDLINDDIVAFTHGIMHVPRGFKVEQHAPQSEGKCGPVPMETGHGLLTSDYGQDVQTAVLLRSRAHEESRKRLRCRSWRAWVARGWRRWQVYRRHLADGGLWMEANAPVCPHCKLQKVRAQRNRRAGTWPGVKGL